MLIKSLIKSVATVTAVGSVLAAAQVAGPASTVTAQPETAAAVFAADPYPNSVQTSTRLDLRRHLAQYGTRNVAHVYVNENDNNGGFVRGGYAYVTIANVGTYRGWVSGGDAAIPLPSWLRAQRTYEIRATYRPVSGSQYKVSRSLWNRYTVMKAFTRAAPSVRNTPRGTRPRVNIRVTSATGKVVNGRVAVRLFKDGHRKGYRAVTLRNGRASVAFRRAWQRGIWDVSVNYRGTRNFERDSVTTWFRVTRR